MQATYEQFTEGFDTADLREAKALMHDLKRSLGRKGNERTGTTDKTSRRFMVPEAGKSLARRKGDKSSR